MLALATGLLTLALPSALSAQSVPPRALLQSGIQRGQATVATPMRAGGTRTQIGAPQDLGTHIVASGRGSAVTFKPFTLEEVVARATQAGKIRTERGVQQVLANGAWVAAAVYVEKVNLWEKWLTGYGYSLRDPGPVPLHFSLRQRGGKSGPQVGPLMRRPDILGNPEIRNPNDLRPGEGMILDGRLIAGRYAPTAGAPAGGSFMPKSATAFAGSSGGASGPCPDKCTLSYGKNAGQASLSAVGAQIVNDEMVKTGVCATAGPDSAKLCKGNIIDRDDTTGVVTFGAPAREIYASAFGSPGQAGSIDDFIKTYQDVCKWQALLKTHFSEFYVAAPGSSDGTFESAKGQKAPEFYDGLLRFSGSNILDCLGKTSDNGWFGGSFCLDYSARANYTKAKGFDLADTAGVDASVTLFGQDFTLAHGDRTVAWAQMPGTTPQTAPVTTGDVTFYKDSKRFETPPVVVPIGPVPLSISAYLDARFNVGAPDPIFDKAGIAKLVTKAKPAVGTIGAPVGAEAELDLGLTAAIDAVVVKAGIDAQLTMLKGTLGGSIQSIVNAPNNVATIRKQYGFQGVAFAGSVSAFVEVDLILYTKKWSITLVDFDGIHANWTPVQKDATASAIIPSSEQPATCP